MLAAAGTIGPYSTSGADAVLSQSLCVAATGCPACAAYPWKMPAQPALTAEEWFERMRNAAPPADDDVTILWDGRRLDSRQKVLEWLAEVEASRAEGLSSGAHDRS